MTGLYSRDRFIAQLSTAIHNAFTVRGHHPSADVAWLPGFQKILNLGRVTQTEPEPLKEAIIQAGHIRMVLKYLPARM